MVRTEQHRDERGFLGLRALGEARIPKPEDQAEHDESGKAGRGQALLGLVGHLAHWGLYPEFMSSPRRRNQRLRSALG